MPLTFFETLGILLAVAAGMIVTRFAPFVLFPDSKKPPEFVSYLGRVLPPAVMGLLVVYCLKGVRLTAFPFGLPELIAIGVVVLVHFWRHNTLLSIGAGTVCYMLLVQMVFV